MNARRRPNKTSHRAANQQTIFFCFRSTKISAQFLRPMDLNFGSLLSFSSELEGQSAQPGFIKGAKPFILLLHEDPSPNSFIRMLVIRLLSLFSTLIYILRTEASIGTYLS